MIKVLEKSIADKIAAGEVVERPLSIVKELVENAIDSGANSIVVEIKNGGKTYIRVTDNGCGIPSAEVEMAFLRHATSKIVTAADLNSIETLGFRGEALASIAAVTRTELVTKTSEEKAGVKVIIHGGEIIENIGIGCPDGTTIVISDLFYNTPARQKFLKSDSAESSRIIEFLSQIALAYPRIKFRLINKGDIVFSTTGTGDMLSAIMSVYQQKEYADLVPLDYTYNGNRINGFISRPSLSKTTRKSQVFFVNGRVVSSKVIEKGVTEGYSERLFEGRFPVTFLFIETNPSKLDVNIHPNKREVRFDDEQEIVSLVREGIKQGLGTKEAVVEMRNVFKAEEASENNIFSKEDTQVDIKQILSTKRAELTVKENPVSYVVPEEPTTIQNSKPTLSIESPKLIPFDFRDLTLTGSIFGTYITATDDTNFYLIDQHAVHERVFYEQLVTEYLSEEKARQPILTPILLEVPLATKETEYDWMDALIEMGFSLELFGPSAYVIREIPTFMTISEAEDFAKTYIEQVEDGEHLLNTVVINKLITKSCKRAVKAHDYLSMEEIHALIQSLMACKNPFSCPHGRPTFIKLSNYEIERMFKRV